MHPKGARSSMAEQAAHNRLVVGSNAIRALKTRTYELYLHNCTYVIFTSIISVKSLGCLFCYGRYRHNFKQTLEKEVNMELNFNILKTQVINLSESKLGSAVKEWVLDEWE